MRNAILERGLATLPKPIIGAVHPATRRLLANWGNELRSLRRFVPDKRHAVVLCFLRAALTETVDAVVEMQDKLITGAHSLINSGPYGTRNFCPTSE